MTSPQEGETKGGQGMLCYLVYFKIKKKKIFVSSPAEDSTIHFEFRPLIRLTIDNELHNR